jgi:hypothetical protein
VQRIGAVTSGEIGLCLDDLHSATTAGNVIDNFTCNWTGARPNWVGSLTGLVNSSVTLVASTTYSAYGSIATTSQAGVSAPSIGYAASYAPPGGSGLDDIPRGNRCRAVFSIQLQPTGLQGDCVADSILAHSITDEVDLIRGVNRGANVSRPGATSSYPQRPSVQVKAT